jgi:adenine-specific DNA-methyltransferase
MSEKLTRFTKLMKEIFELDKSDLDFGIYRIMNIRKAEIEKFLNVDLVKKVQETLKPFACDDGAVKARLAEIEKTCSDVGIEIEKSKMSDEYATLKKQLTVGMDIDALETDVYSALYSFFNRYYDEGDFISKRRYKEGVYAIPYEGEEVKLYWANQDQYYIKTSENFKDYTFNADNFTIHFRIVDATTEQNNNKESDDNKRIFMLYAQNDEMPDIKTFERNGNELIIRFVFDVPKDKSTKYDEENYKKISSEIMQNQKDMGSALIRNVSTDPKKPLTCIEKHLKAYVAKNTFDYFIHKDLRGFLSRELDFYIKSELIHLDDLDTPDEKRVNTFLAKVKAVKRVGKVIIDFLAQIEDYQKKLWLKKKFVVETNWCITLDKINVSFYPEIIANKAQVKEWIDMYAIDEIEGNLTSVAYSDPLTFDFLKQNNNLVIDTKHFSNAFKDRLIAKIENLDEQTNGLMIHSENFQALNFLHNRYKNKIQTTYIDPPYNTVYSEIIYKNNYKHSSWLSLMNNTMPLLPEFWANDFSFGLAIDDLEFVNLAQLIDSNFPNLERSVVVVNHHPQGAGGRISRTHEYYILLSNSKSPAYLGEPLDDYQEDRSFMRSGTGENNFRFGRWKSFYALLVDPKTNTITDVEDPLPLGEDYPTEPTPEGYKRVYPINSKGEERVWRASYLTGRERAKNGELTITNSGTVYQSIDHESKREVLFSNWTDAKFNAGIQGSNLLRDMGLGGEFDYPKSIKTLETGLWAQTFGNSNSIIMDFFAGSGTTGHATLNLNKFDKGNRKYILVEMGSYFNSATKPRIKKAVYAPGTKDWKDGKPVNRTTGVSHIMKYIRLESYEDALSNIEFSDANKGMFNIFGEDYLINYMLNVETKDSLLKIDCFKTPFEYKLKINENNETKEKIIDLTETFNYLIGLTVLRQSAIAYFNASPDDKGEYEGAVRLEKNDNGKYAFKQVEGRLPDGRKALIIWRNMPGNPVEDNAALDAYFEKNRINPQDREFDVIYVNGDNNLENLKTENETWKVQLTELEFKKKMFEEA